MTSDNSGRFEMSLVDNGTDSLEKGLEAFIRYSSSKETIHLKDAIMALHHGMELLLKELLVRESEYLIFEDIRQAAKKKRQADKQGVEVLFLPNPPRTVSFLEALERVEVFLKPKSLDAPLIGSLNQLNSIRNQVEHYAIDADAQELVSLMSRIQAPLLNFLSRNLKDVDSIRRISNAQAWNIARMENAASENAVDRVAGIIEMFRSQVVPGILFNALHDVELPETSKISPSYRHERFPQYSVDLYVETKLQAWIAEVKQSMPKDVRSVSRIRELSFFASLISGQPWIVSLEDIPGEIVSEAQASRVYMSGPKELDELEKKLCKDDDMA